MVTLNGEKILDDVVRAYHAACARHGRSDLRCGSSPHGVLDQVAVLRKCRHD
jgi:hypothetical protein